MSGSTVEFWEGSFGDEYHERNPEHVHERAGFWHALLSSIEPHSVLEVGCGTGINLAHVGKEADAWGVEINDNALIMCRANNPLCHVTYGNIYDLPFKDGFFDMTFTCGVLIHQPPQHLPHAMGEVIRCSKRWVLLIEYESEQMEGIAYRGHSDALWKGPYTDMYEKMGLALTDRGFVGKKDGFDDCSWSLLEKV